MRPLKPLTVLRRLRKLFSVRERWTKGAMARNRATVPVDPSSADAVCWCLGGACIKVDKQQHRSGELWRLLSEQAQCSPATINDKFGYAAVLALLDRTIAAERAKGET